MSLPNTNQPQGIPIGEDLRLRAYDGNYRVFLPAYQDPYVYQNSEGIFDDAKKPTLDYVRWMCEYLCRVGELYYIEVLDGDSFRPVGDVTIKPENPPIAIWEGRYRGCGIGRRVMEVVIHRLRTLGYGKITGSTVYTWNLPSQKLHEGLGFRKVGEAENEIYYELDL